MVSAVGGTEEHFPGLSSSSERSESSSGENHVVDEGSQDLSHSEQDDSSEKMGLISEAASPPGSPVQPTPDLASAISNWVQFEDDTPWSSTSPPHKETGEPGRKLRKALVWNRLWKGLFCKRSVRLLGFNFFLSSASWKHNGESNDTPTLTPHALRQGFA